MFYLYSLTASLSKKIPKNDFNLKLLKYITCFSKLKDLDLEVTKALVDFTEVISKNKSLRLIENKIMDLGSLITKIRTQAKTMKKKFGMESKFCKIYATFLRDVMNDERGKSLLEKYGLVSTRMSLVFRETSDFDSKDPLLIISGWHNNIGTIVYGNSSIYSLLKIKTPADFIGINISNIISTPFNEIFTKFLARLLIFRNSSESKISHLFLINQEKYTIEVFMHINVTYHNFSPSFVITLKPILTENNLILFSSSGQVYSKSEKIQNIFPNQSHGIEGVIPNIGKYLEANDLEKIFFYSEEINCYMKISELYVEDLNIKILYIFKNLENISEDYFMYNRGIKTLDFEETSQFDEKYLDNDKEKELE